MLTAVYKKVRSGDVAWDEEIPGVNTEGTTKAEARTNLAGGWGEAVAARPTQTKQQSTF